MKFFLPAVEEGDVAEVVAIESFEHGLGHVLRKGDTEAAMCKHGAVVDGS